LAKAKESFEKWVHDKDAERKRFNEEKRMEKEEQEVEISHFMVHFFSIVFRS
jgi:hypothetical protein